MSFQEYGAGSPEWGEPERVCVAGQIGADLMVNVP